MHHKFYKFKMITLEFGICLTDGILCLYSVNNHVSRKLGPIPWCSLLLFSLIIYYKNICSSICSTRKIQATPSSLRSSEDCMSAANFSECAIIVISNFPVSRGIPCIKPIFSCDSNSNPFGSSPLNNFNFPRIIIIVKMKIYGCINFY